MKNKRNKHDGWGKNDFRNLNDIALAKKHYQYQIELQESVLFYEAKELRQNFAESVKTSIRKFSTKLMVVSLIKLVKAQITKRRN